jgi:hypothetical protein
MTSTMGRPRNCIPSARNDHLYSLTRQRAEFLAEQIRAFWEEKGRPIRVWVEPIHETSVSEWVVRSDLAVVEKRLR